MAAVVLVILNPRGPDVDETWGQYAPVHDEDTAEGEPGTDDDANRVLFDLELVRRDDGGTEKLAAGATVHPGDRVQFVVYPQRPGFLMVVGQDAEGDVYKAYPKQGERAKKIKATKGAVTLPDSIGLDDVLGRERIVGLICDDAFGFAELTAALADGKADATQVAQNCEQKSISLVKRPERPTTEEGLEQSDLATGLGPLGATPDPSAPREGAYPPSAGDDAGAQVIQQ